MPAQTLYLDPRITSPVTAVHPSHTAVTGTTQLPNYPITNSAPER